MKLLNARQEHERENIKIENYNNQEIVILTLDKVMLVIQKTKNVSHPEQIQYSWNSLNTEEKNYVKGCADWFRWYGKKKEVYL